MDDGEFVEADDHQIGGGGPAIIPCNWLQHFENVVDPFHVRSCTASFSGTQFTEEMARCPSDVEIRPRGVTSVDPQPATARRFVASPRRRCRPCAWSQPACRQFGRVESIGWTLPIDDTHFRIYVAGRVKSSGDIGRMRSQFNGKFWWDMTEQEHRQFPGDYEAQVSQGAVTVHSEEHLARATAASRC